jgi:hypothetical protein
MSESLWSSREERPPSWRKNADDGSFFSPLCRRSKKPSLYFATFSLFVLTLSVFTSKKRNGPTLSSRQRTAKKLKTDKNIKLSLQIDFKELDKITT